MVAFVIGGPGSGKGTQCQRIASSFGFKHLSAGELLREERQRKGSPLAKEIEEVICAGGAVSSETIAKLLGQAMEEAGGADSKFIVDGYPRTMDQLRGWESTLNTRVRFLFCLFLRVGRDEMRTRVLDRGLTSGRLDDNLATVEKRFVTFEEETGPLLDHFESLGLLHQVDGERGVDEVWTDVERIFQAAESAG